MESIKIDSTNIKIVYYDENKKEMFVFFHTGNLYKYFEIDRNIINKFKLENNKTKYLKENLHRYTKIY